MQPASTLGDETNQPTLSSVGSGIGDIGIKPYPINRRTASSPDHLPSAKTVYNCAQPLASAETTSDCPQPAASAEPIVDRPQPSASAEPTVDCPRPSAPVKPSVVCPQPAASAEPTVDRLQPSASAEPTVVYPQPSAPVKPSVVCPQPSTSVEQTVVCPQPSAPVEQTVVCPQPTAPYKQTVVCPQSSASAEPTSDCRQPAASVETTVDCLQPSASAESTVDRPQPSASAETTFDCPQPSASEEQTVDCPKTSIAEKKYPVFLQSSGPIDAMSDIDNDPCFHRPANFPFSPGKIPPKKDRCDICMGFETGNVDKEFWTTHMNDKRRAEKEKAKDKKEAQERNGAVMICMDLQGVLLAPSISSSSTYFKTKLTVHNFTLYNMVTKDAVCYVWHKAEGGLISNKFTSCIIDHLSSLLGANKIVLYCDGCIYQNKNSVLASALSAFSLQREYEVQQKYFVKGETVVPQKRKTHGLKIYHRFHFQSSLKRMSVINGHTSPGSTEIQYNVAVKGAPETLKSMFSSLPEDYDDVYLKMARRGARVLALGYKKIGNLTHQQVGCIATVE
ncbi:cation-transporting ATPase [Plakobranchus ocellatus]|uniref:Cation-transporting ATPase n=1 Tax=Plakobranchus ocellatus TaxID=259542 RepID=A0AAV4DR89_9GAST|nr:cation-transporting ATPase [Plakobranchus ocellatus]